MIDIQLLQPHAVNGKGYHPGDWLKVPLRRARQLCADGTAWTPQHEQLYDNGCGVVLTGNVQSGRKQLKNLTIEIAEGTAVIEYDRTLIWDATLPIQVAMLPVGLSLLDNWQVCVPLFDYGTLAAGVGDEEDRERTRVIIHDLRVPLYEPRLMFVKDCEEGHHLVRLWQQEIVKGDYRLAFARALYQVRPLICALPADWHG